MLSSAFRALFSSFSFLLRFSAADGFAALVAVFFAVLLAAEVVFFTAALVDLETVFFAAGFAAVFLEAVVLDDLDAVFFVAAALVVFAAGFFTEDFFAAVLVVFLAAVPVLFLAAVFLGAALAAAASYESYKDHSGEIRLSGFRS